MVTDACKYCGSRNIGLNPDRLVVCYDCASVMGPLYTWQRKKISRKEQTLAFLYGYA
jgi:hypothetical protein